MTPAEQTAAFVAMHRRVGTVVTRRRVPRARFPTLLESDYAQVLVDMVRSWAVACEPLIAALPDLLASADRVRADDTSEARRVHTLLERARYLVTGAARQVDGIAERIGRQVAQHHRQEFSRQTKAALGVELPTLDRALPATIDAFAAENAKLVESLGARTIADIEKLTVAVFARGGTVEDLTAEISKRFAIAERGARFIARDQLGDLAARIARQRHKEVGIKQFRWMSQADGRVRPTHRVKHGRVFSYSGEHRPVFMPGEERGCRCGEEPVFDEIVALAGIPQRAKVGGYTAVRR